MDRDDNFKICDRRVADFEGGAGDTDQTEAAQEVKPDATPVPEKRSKSCADIVGENLPMAAIKHPLRTQSGSTKFFTRWSICAAMFVILALICYGLRQAETINTIKNFGFSNKPYAKNSDEDLASQYEMVPTPLNYEKKGFFKVVDQTILALSIDADKQVPMIPKSMVLQNVQVYKDQEQVEIRADRVNNTIALSLKDKSILENMDYSQLIVYVKRSEICANIFGIDEFFLYAKIMKYYIDSDFQEGFYNYNTEARGEGRFVQTHHKYDIRRLSCAKDAKYSNLEYLHQKNIVPVPKTQLDHIKSRVSSTKPKYYFFYSFDSVFEQPQRANESEVLMVTYDFGQRSSTMTEFSYKVYSVTDVVSTVGGLLTPIRLTFFLIVGMILSDSFWQAEATSIKEYQIERDGDSPDSLKEIEVKMHQRISFCAVYNLFDEVTQLEHKVARLERKNEQQAETNERLESLIKDLQGQITALKSE